MEPRNRFVLLSVSATKTALQEALPSGIIHLATHGFFDQEGTTDSLFSSFLIFAGYNRWARTKILSEEFGNGILTADEISRMDLRNCGLVVLSSCQSGLESDQGGTMQGLISAFSAAGASWIVSSLWHVDDYATSILMDAFYASMFDRQLPVPDALRTAKHYLRTVTVDELWENGWLELPDGLPVSEETRKNIERLKNSNGRRKPFSDERFWGGFVCHKCK